MTAIAGILQRASGLGRRRTTCRLLGHRVMPRTIMVQDKRATKVCGRCGEPVGGEVPYRGDFVDIEDPLSPRRPA